MKNNIILVGMMGAGKTFIGKALKETYPDKNFVDVDEYIENMKNMKIYEIFKNFGEEYFRNLETESLKDLTEKSNQIISVGGGAFEREENRFVLNNNGYTVYLKATAEAIFERIKHETHRPLLQQEFGVDKISDILSKREHNYEKALIKIDTVGKSKYNVICEIMKRIEEYAQ